MNIHLSKILIVTLVVGCSPEIKDVEEKSPPSSVDFTIDEVVTSQIKVISLAGDEYSWSIAIQDCSSGYSSNIKSPDLPELLYQDRNCRGLLQSIEAEGTVYTLDDSLASEQKIGDILPFYSIDRELRNFTVIRQLGTVINPSEFLEFRETEVTYLSNGSGVRQASLASYGAIGNTENPFYLAEIQVQELPTAYALIQVQLTCRVSLEDDLCLGKKFEVAAFNGLRLEDFAALDCLEGDSNRCQQIVDERIQLSLLTQESDAVAKLTGFWTLRDIPVLKSDLDSDQFSLMILAKIDQSFFYWNVNLETAVP